MATPAARIDRQALSVFEAKLAAGRFRPVRDETVSVATTSTQVAAGNPNRVRLELFNQGSDDVRVIDGQPAETGTHFLLPATTGALAFDWRAERGGDGIRVFDEYQAISEGAAAVSVRVREIAVI